MSSRLQVQEWRTVRGYFEQLKYPLFDLRLSFQAPGDGSGFPDFAAMRAAVAQLDPALSALFQLFRLGETIEDEALDRAIPAKVASLLRDAGLLVRGAARGWRTPGLVLVPVGPLLLLVGLPAHYPTCTVPVRALYSLSSSLLASAIPSDLSGERVLDICSGSGVLALLCATRGSARAVGLELAEEGVAIGRINADLNGLGDRVEFRSSDVLSALRRDETFDFVICNTPYVPMLGSLEVPGSIDAIGNGVLQRLLPVLAPHLSARAHGVLAAWTSPGKAGVTGQMLACKRMLHEHGFGCHALVDRAADTVESVLAQLQESLARSAQPEVLLIEEILQASRRLFDREGALADAFYDQLLFFEKRGEGSAIREDVYGFFST